MKLKKLLVIVLLIFTFELANAKRADPNDVPSVTVEGKTFNVIHYSRNGFGFNYGGCIEIVDHKTNRTSNFYIYKSYRDFFLEGDVQDFFIKTIEVDKSNKYLRIVDEKNHEYIYDIKKGRLIGIKGIVQAYGWFALFCLTSLIAISKSRKCLTTAST